MEFVFARGSGQPQDTGKSFLEFQKNMTLAAKQAKLSYRITDLSYEAVAISVANVLGTYVSAGEAYSFGRSIDGGVSQLEYYMRSRASCANTYWVLAGYSQGAMVVANSLKSFDADKVVYVALFGDPKLYLPEGEGFNPPACRGEELSEYRVYVPDCDTDNGILGARQPYELASLAGRYGLWCNDNDFICGSSKNPLNTRGHSRYEENGSYYDASMLVLRRLKYLRNNHALLLSSLTNELEESEEKLGSVFAQLSQYRYYVEVGDELVLDASGSFSVDGGELKYTWFMDGMVLAETSDHLSLRFDKNDDHYVELEVSDTVGEKARVSATVIVGRAYIDEPLVSSPRISASRCGEKRICLSWAMTRSSGSQLALRINDYFMGFMDSANGELVIDDVDFSDIRVSVGSLDGQNNLGEMVDLKIDGVMEPVPTSASPPWWRIVVIALLPFGILLLARMILRLVSDLARVK